VNSRFQTNAGDLFSSREEKPFSAVVVMSCIVAGPSLGQKQLGTLLQYGRLPLPFHACLQHAP
jgi:hypothetical protein